jgi:hypothetical protein
MLTKTLCSFCATACVSFGAFAAEANIQSNRWFHAVAVEGRDIAVTIQLIEEDPPNFDTTFTLTGGGGTIFQNKQFTREEADEVVGSG